MPGIKNIVLGLVLMVAGGIIFTTADLGEGMPTYGVWGLIACGALILAFGLYKPLMAGSSGADADEVYKTDTIARLILQSTISTALADGPLDDVEVEMIATACEPVVHERLNRNSIRRVAKIIDARGNEILDEIHSEGRLLNLDARKAIIGACILVLKADGAVDVRQTAVVTAIARHLDFSQEETQALIVEAMQEGKKG